MSGSSNIGMHVDHCVVEYAEILAEFEAAIARSMREVGQPIMPTHRTRRTQSVDEAIAFAEHILPGVIAPEDEEDPRWQAIIEVGEYISTELERVWEFIVKWGSHEDDDLRTAIATCLLEELLADQFEPFFSRVEQRVSSDFRFADTFSRCWMLERNAQPDNPRRFDALQSQLQGDL